MDLTGQPYLYYLDALELLEPANLMYARTVCVAECPSTEDLCSLHNLPCTNDTQYVCPYYRTADQDLWTRLPADVSPTETAYWSDLANVQMDKAQCSNDFVSVSRRSTCLPAGDTRRPAG
jgi:choline transporter-like protein 2/4/5